MLPILFAVDADADAVDLFRLRARTSLPIFYKVFKQNQTRLHWCDKFKLITRGTFASLVLAGIVFTTNRWIVMNNLTKGLWTT